MSDTIFPNDGRMKPILIVPPDTISDEDIKGLRDNGLCVVVSKDPGAVKFLDPVPSMVGRTEIENAAIKFSRKILDRKTFITESKCWKSLDRSEVWGMFMSTLSSGTALDPERENIERQKETFFANVKADEVRIIAREEARAEAAARKAAKAKVAK